MDNKTEFIKKAMKNLDLTEQEALELWEIDNAPDTPEDIAEAKRVKQTIGRNYVACDKTKRKTPQKERKVNTTKLMLFELIQKVLPQECTNISLKTETELNFTFENKNYTLKLTEHRQNKGGK